MTKREVKRLKKFLSSHMDRYRRHHIFLVTQQDEYVSQPPYCNKKPDKFITDVGILNIPYNQIKQIDFRITTRYNTFYF